MRKGGLVVAALAVLLLALSGCGDSSEGSGGSAHINEDSGSTHDLIADERTGTAPPPAKVTNLRKAAEDANCFLVLDRERKKGEEVPPGTQPPRFGVYPPPSGPYVEAPHQQADGAYLNLPDTINWLGSLSNGRMAIQYAPDLSEKSQLELKGLYDTMYGATLLFPDDEMQYAVAATSWANFLGCTTYETQKTLDALRAFGKATWGKHGKNPVDSVPFEGPTPADPEEQNENG